MKRLGLSLPSMPIIECLRTGDFSEPELLKCVRALVLDEYKVQYKRAKLTGNHDLIESWDDETWKDFFGPIS